MPLKLIVDSKLGVVSGPIGLLRKVGTGTIEEIDTTDMKSPSLSKSAVLTGTLNLYLTGDREVAWTTDRCPYLISVYDALPVCQQEQLLVDIRSTIEEEIEHVCGSMID